MHYLIVAALCIAGSLANEVKNATAQGAYGVPQDYNPQPTYDQGYGAQQPANYFAGYQYIRPPQPPLMDRDVCDLDASVLLVVHSRRFGPHRHHHHHHDRMNRAHRVRCSVIANYDESSCNVCCQHAARRDKNLKNSQFFGFLAVTDDFEHRPHGCEKEPCDEEPDFMAEEEHMRAKREHHYENIEGITVPEFDFKPLPYFKNVKCVCCAPKRPLLPPPVFPVPPVQPIYQQPSAYPAASQPTYQSNDQPTYQQPQQQQPTYPQPQQQQPTYEQPQQQPTYQQPQQQQPTYVAPQPAQAPPAQTYQPAAAQPTYQAPAQNPQPY